MNFTSPDKVYTLIEAMRTADQPRAFNRTLIDELFNGFPPFTEAQAKENLLDTNVNFLEGPNIAHSARQQIYNALLKPSNYFTVKQDFGPAHLKDTWSRGITSHINRPMKRKMMYSETLRATGAQLVLHGIGPVFWEDKVKWCPYARGIEDVLVPSGTEVSMEDLDHVALFRRYTPIGLYRQTHGKHVDPGWNVKLAEKVITQLSKDYAQTTNWSDWRFPEKLAEDLKANSGYYGSDAVPTVNCWDFFYLNDEGDGWNRKIIIDSQNPANAAGIQSLAGTQNFLYDSKERVYAEKLEHFMHVQFADTSSVAPFRWHSVRSLGYLLFNVCHLQNRLRSRFMDSVFESLLWYFRNVADDDREKLLQVQLHHMGIIPQGVDFVPANERYNVNEELVNMGLSQNRQLMSENSAAFVQDVNDGTSKELTATETMARVSQANAMVGGMLNLMYLYQTSQYREIARRFCTSPDPDCKEFRDKCQKDGIPKEALDVDRWDIEPERVLGAGNKMLEIAQADRLMAARNLYDPEAQRQILHDYTEVNSDAQKAEALVPMQPDQSPSDSENQASLAMGTLMLGLPVAPPRDISYIEYTETLLTLTAAYVQQVEQTGGMVEEDRLRGLINTVNYIKALIQHIAGDPNEKQRVKQYSDALSQIEALVKAFAQRLQEQKSQMQLDPETQSKIQTSQALAQSKIQLTQATTQQKMQQSDAKFRQKMQQGDLKTQASLGEQAARTQSDLQEQEIRTMADLQEQDMRAAMDARVKAAEMNKPKEP